MRQQIPTTHTNLDLINIDHVPSNGTHSGSTAMLYVCEDNDAETKMMIKRPKSHMGDMCQEPAELLWIGCLTRLIFGSKIESRYIDTKQTTRRHVDQRKFHT